MLTRWLKRIRVWRRRRNVASLIRRAKALSLTLPCFTEPAEVERHVYGDNIAFGTDNKP